MSNPKQDSMDATGRRDNQQTTQQPRQQQPAQGNRILTEREFKDVNYASGFKHIGKAMIINNSFAKQNVKTRERSDHDSEELEKLFTDLGFEGVLINGSNVPKMVFREVTKKRLQELLRDASDDRTNNYTDYSCFVCIILSYGETGVVECVAEETSSLSSKYEISEMQNFFKGHKCETLKMKPKLFFIQASPFPKGDQMDDTNVPGQKGPDVIVHKIPREADILTQVCNIIDFDSDDGMMSYYPRALKEAFEQYVLNKERPMELNTLLIRVNGLIKQYLEKHGLCPNKELPIPIVTTLLTKHMYFNKSMK